MLDQANLQKTIYVDSIGFDVFISYVSVEPCILPISRALKVFFRAHLSADYNGTDTTVHYSCLHVFLKYRTYGWFKKIKK